MRPSNARFPAELQSAVARSLIPASRLAAAQFRLDAPAFISQEQLSTFMLGISNSQPLSELADVFTVYIQSPILAYVQPFEQSRPYLTTSELAEYQTGARSHVSLVADPRLIGWEVKECNIVVSRSGRVGEAYWVDRKLDGVLVGDSFRVVPKNGENPIIIYAVHASDMARNYLSGSAYGSVVDHASLDQLRAFPIPSLPRHKKNEIASRIRDAIAARDKAYSLLDEAQSSLLDANGLHSLDGPNPAGRDDSNTVVHSMVSCKEVTIGHDQPTEFRLEAHFHNPRARAAIEQVQGSRSSRGNIGQLAHDVILAGRFRRNYVEADYGRPFLSGKNIVQTRPTDLKHLSTSETEDLGDCLLKRGWVLITRSGTVGRTCLVWHNFEGYAASEHILRVIPDEGQVDAGYLYAFLSSPYGYEQMVRFRHGSVIDEITDAQLKKVAVPLPERGKQRQIGDKVRLAYEKRSEALRLEDKAQEILMQAISVNGAREKKRHV